MKNNISLLMNKVKQLQMNEGSGHDWWHTLRVYNNAIAISKSIDGNYNREIIEIAALLHDIADHKFGYSDTDREKVISELFTEFELDPNIREEVITIVNNISFSKNGSVTTIEGKIVQDADRLDAIGFIGIARTFTYGGYANRSIYIPVDERIEDEVDTLDHFEEKLFKIADRMNTDVGREKAIKRTAKMTEFISGFHNEWNGLE